MNVSKNAMGVARWPKNVTTRERAAARSADTPAESRNRHAPTWHFAGIRPRRVTNTRSTATRNVPRQQHVVVEHVYRPVDEPDPVGHGGDTECAHCLGAGSDYRRCDPDHQAIDEAGTEHRRDHPGAALDEERQRASRPQSGWGGRTVDAAGAGRDDAPATRRTVRSGSSVITVPTDEYGIARGPQRVRLFNTYLDAVAAALHSRYSRESVLKCAHETPISIARKALKQPLSCTYNLCRDGGGGGI